MHWDEARGVCKYVVLPDTGTNTLPASINGNPVVYSPVQGPDGKYYPVVKREYSVSFLYCDSTCTLSPSFTRRT